MDLVMTVVDSLGDMNNIGLNGLKLPVLLALSAADHLCVSSAVTRPLF